MPQAFPGWHRAYLLEFERTLRKADMALGGDGNIGLPYWNWAEPKRNGEVFPSIIKDKLSVLPVGFFPDGMDRFAWDIDLLKDITPDAELEEQLGAVGKVAADSLLTQSHLAMASVRRFDKCVPHTYRSCACK